MTMRTNIVLLLLMILLAGSRGSNECLQPEDRGTCYNYVEKYLYDKNIKQCRPFLYGSCGGNANRFDSIELCHRACITARQDQDDTDYNDRNEIPESQILLEITDNLLSPVSDLCQLPKDTGPCRDFTTKWFFDSRLQDCNRFWYGSCQGNGNRFDDVDTCRRRCKKETNSESLPVNKLDNTRQQEKPKTACEQPQDRGTCQDYILFWHFDLNSAACRQFWYGGCGGNDNRFSSKEECEAKCIKASTVRPGQTTVGCAHSKYGCCTDKQTSAEGPNYKGCKENCEDSIYGCCPDGVTQPEGPNQDGCEIGSGNVPCEQTKHGCCADGITTASGPSFKDCADTPDSERTSVGAQDRSTVAMPEKKCTAPVPKHQCQKFEVKWRFESETQECVRHWWGGCADTGNVFDSKEACNSECKKTVVKPQTVSSKQATCTALESIVLCAEKYSIKWRFNNAKQECVRHWWGGCADNGNVFESQGDCEAVCMNSLVITNPDAVDPDFVNICDMEVDAGPCTDNIQRYYYDPRNRKCKIFNYGGCQGNENNFASIEDCQRQCMGGVEISHTATSTDIPKPETSTLVTVAMGTTAEQDENARSSIKMSGQSTAEKGSSIHIRCNAVGPTQPNEIEWFFNGRLITTEDSDVSINTLANHQLKQALVSELVIKNVDQENAGTYYCRSRPYGDLEKMRIAVVEERVTPEVTNRRDPTAVCLMKAESGNCYANIPRYHYDHQSGNCLQFTYGGCGGNQNNFETLQECSHFCSDKEVCHQPREVGRCRAAHPRFYFDSQTRSCENFIYGGCDGNLNNFATKEACDKKCHHYKHTSSHTNATITNEDKDPTVCQLGPEKGTCRGYEIKWYYVPERNRCARFVYTGCGGNGNQFNTQEECSSTCLKVENSDNRGRQTVPPLPTRQSTVFYPKSSSAPREARGDYELVLAKLGDTAVLTCSLRSVGVLWYRDGLLLSSSSKIHVYHNGTLYLRSVTEDMAGLYNCRIISANNVQHVEKFKVQVYVPPKIVPAPHLVSMMPGHNVFVHCQAVGTPEPVVSWSRGGHTLRTNDRYSVFANGTLIIHNVHIQDAGEYECSADNGIAATSKTFRLSIKETIGADVESHRGIYTEGETIELHCKGTGYPTPKLEWVKEGRELTSGGTISVVNGVLTVTAATIEDAGMYKCIAFNEKGKAEDSTVVQISLHNPLTKCEDNLGRTRCHLIVTGRLCGFRHFATHCCRSCRKAGFL